MKIEFKNTFLFISILLILVGCSTTKNNISSNINKTPHPSGTPLKEGKFKTGAENIESYLPMLKDKRVGIVTNQTGILSKEKHLVDFLMEQNINLQKIYAPEHGFRGTADAGELIVDGKDTKTNLPIISLYGNNKKPKPEQLDGIDILVFDLQDVGEIGRASCRERV